MTNTNPQTVTPSETISGYLWRVDRYGQRYYTDGQTVFPSVTTLIKKVLPQSPFLEAWKMEKGKEEADRISSEKADYGTVFHVMASDFLNGHKIPLDEDSILGRAMASQLGTMRIRSAEEIEQLGWIPQLQKGLLSLAQWVKDYDVRVDQYMDRDGYWQHMTELPVSYKSEDVQFAGTIDLVCVMNAKKYTDKTPMEKRERVFAIVDFKTGGIWDDYPIQLEMYKMALEQGMNLERDYKLYNWQPSDFRGDKPTYKLTDQTNKVAFVPELLALYSARFGEMSLPDKRVYSGNLSVYGDLPTIETLTQHEQIGRAIGMTSEELTDYIKKNL